MFIEICTKEGNESTYRLEWHSNTAHAYHIFPYVCRNVGVFMSWFQLTAATKFEVCVFTVEDTDRCCLSSGLRVALCIHLIGNTVNA